MIDLGATFNVSTSVREIESPLSDEISSDLQETKEDRKSPAFSTLSTDTEKLSLGKIDCIEKSFLLTWSIIPILCCMIIKTISIYRPGNLIQLQAFIRPTFSYSWLSWISHLLSRRHPNFRWRQINKCLRPKRKWTTQEAVGNQCHSSNRFIQNHWCRNPQCRKTR